jgi:hypothetical protein
LLFHPATARLSQLYRWSGALGSEHATYLPLAVIADAITLPKVLNGESVPIEDLVHISREAVTRSWIYTPPDLDLAKLLDKRQSTQEFEDAFYPHRPALRKSGLAGLYPAPAPEGYWAGWWTGWSSRFAPDDQFRLWTFRNPNADPEIEPYELVSQGWEEQAAVEHVYPVRYLLLTLGRPDVEARARYTAWMTAKIAEEREAKEAAIRQRAEAQAAIALGLGLAACRDKPADGADAQQRNGGRAELAPPPVAALTVRPSANDLVESAIRGLEVIRREHGRRPGPKPHAAQRIEDRPRIERAVATYLRLAGGASWDQILNDDGIDDISTPKRWDAWLREELERDPHRHLIPLQL